MLRRALVISLVAVAFGGAVQAGDDAAATITGPELQAHVDYLASDALQGRETGSDGERAAGDYLARALAGYGLEPAGVEGTFFQPFTVAGHASVKTATLRMDRGDFYRDFDLGRDYQPFGFSGSGELDVPLVFAGYGVTDPQRSYDDYAGLDVRGKAVLILRHEPRETQGQASQHAHFTQKALNARAHGAVAMFVVTDPLNHAGDEAVLPFGTAGGDDLGLIAAHVRQSLARGLVRLAGRDLTEVQRKLDETLQPDSFDIGARVRVSFEVERTNETARNVIARLPGSDPALRDELIVIGAHYDHVGLGHSGNALDSPRADGQVHNGADDNASGTSGMLELAQALAGGPRPRRTILFMGFSGEERGLLGSQRWVAQPTVPIANVVAMVNLDMIGRLREKLEVGGTGTSPGFADLVRAACEPLDLATTLDPSGYGPSDHASFYAARIPVLFFFTGLHDDYHRATDDADKFNHEGAARVTRAAFACAEQLANADARPPYVEVAPAGRGPRGPRLGVRLDAERASGGVGVTAVVEGSPAARAGIQAGDIIVRLGEVDIDTPRDLLEALGARAWGDTLPVVVLRGAERVTLEVTLSRQ